MKYSKAVANVVEFEAEDIIVTSDGFGCGFIQFDADNCDGVNQVVSKPGF